MYRLLGKISGLFALASSPDICGGILGYVGKGAAPLVRQLGRRCLFSAFLGLLICPLQVEVLN
jgi:hypothetical protein